MILVDVNAANSVRVVGRKVTGSRPIKDGDVVLMGFGCRSVSVLPVMTLIWTGARH